jgi:hypothetical protein
MKRSTPVTERALVQRINRRLAPTHRKLRKARCRSCPDHCGPFYLLDMTDPQHFAVVENNMTIIRVEEFARELRVLNHHATSTDVNEPTPPVIASTDLARAVGVEPEEVNAVIERELRAGRFVRLPDGTIDTAHN